MLLVSLRTGAGGLALADLSARGAGEAAAECGRVDGAGDGLGFFGDAFVVEAEHTGQFKRLPQCGQTTHCRSTFASSVERRTVSSAVIL